MGLALSSNVLLGFSHYLVVPIWIKNYFNILNITMINEYVSIINKTESITIKKITIIHITR